MRATARLIVMASGVLVLVAIVLMLLSIAYLKGGHPPASGVAVLLIFMVVTPLAACSALAALSTPVEAAGPSPRAFFLMGGVCLAFTVFAITALVLKLVFGATL
jgi:hypothetical protein